MQKLLPLHVKGQKIDFKVHENISIQKILRIYIAAPKAQDGHLPDI